MEKTWSRSRQFIQLALMLWLIYQQMDTHDRINRLLFAYVLGAYVSLASLFWGYIRGTSEYSEYGRFSAEGFNPNDIALVLSIAIPMSWYLSFQFKNTFSVLICKFFLPIAVFAIVLTGSRGSFLAMLISLLIVPLYTNTQQSKKLFSIVSVILVMGFLIVNFTPTMSFDRIMSIKNEVEGGNLTHRSDIWKSGLIIFKNNLMLGVGSGAFPVAIRPYYGKEIVAHNTFLSVLFELGIVGFVLFILIIRRTISNSFRLELYEKIFCLITISVWFVGVQGLSWEYNKTTWIILIVPICYMNCKTRK
ncbi:MAG: O-antigen ligase family protein [Geobacteraceae bacterium]|nr:O-antigen ligase family protein [Geobacteraceae bacterium]